MAKYQSSHWKVWTSFFSHYHGIIKTEKLKERLDIIGCPVAHSIKTLENWRDINKEIPAKAEHYVARAFRLPTDIMRTALEQGEYKGTKVFTPDTEGFKKNLSDYYQTNLIIHNWQLEILLKSGAEIHGCKDINGLNTRLTLPLFQQSDRVGFKWPDPVQMGELAKILKLESQANELGFKSGCLFLADLLWLENKDDFSEVLNQCYSTSVNKKPARKPYQPIIALAFTLAGVATYNFILSALPVPPVRPISPNNLDIIGGGTVLIRWIDDAPATTRKYKLELKRSDAELFAKTETRALKELTQPDGIISTTINITKPGEYNWTVYSEPDTTNLFTHQRNLYLKFNYWKDYLQKVMAKNTLNVAVVTSEKDRFINQHDGMIAGYDTEVLEIIRPHLNQNMKLNYIDTTWPNFMDLMASGKADIAISSITNLADRVKDQNLSFTSPYFHPHQAFFHRQLSSKVMNYRNLPEAIGYATVGVVSGSSNKILAEYLVRESNNPKYFFSIDSNYENITSLIEALKKGNIDFILTDCELPETNQTNDLRIAAVIPESHKQKYIQEQLLNQNSISNSEDYVILTQSDEHNSLAKKISEILQSKDEKEKLNQLSKKLYLEIPECKN